MNRLQIKYFESVGKWIGSYIEHFTFCVDEWITKNNAFKDPCMQMDD